MSNVDVYLPPMFRHLTGTGAVVRVTGTTVGGTVAELVKRYPELKPYLLADSGGIKHGVSVFLNGESAAPDDLSRAVKDGDELHIAQLVLGG